MPTADVETLLHIYMHTIVASVRDKQPDLTARQTGVLLIVYLNKIPQTVRGLAYQLNVPKPVITRALDRLMEFDLVRRKTDPADRRSVLVQRTPRGNAYLKSLTAKLEDAVTKAEAEAEEVE